MAGLILAASHQRKSPLARRRPDPLHQAVRAVLMCWRAGGFCSVAADDRSAHCVVRFTVASGCVECHFCLYSCIAPFHATKPSSAVFSVDSCVGSALAHEHSGDRCSAAFHVLHVVMDHLSVEFTQELAHTLTQLTTCLLVNESSHSHAVGPRSALQLYALVVATVNGALLTYVTFPSVAFLVNVMLR